VEPGAVAGSDEHLELLFSWFDGDNGGPIEDDLDDFLAGQLGDDGDQPRRRYRSRPPRRRRPSAL
jgi:hypothetical protein